MERKYRGELQERRGCSFTAPRFGCATVMLIEIVAVIAICNIAGCEWAERTTIRVVGGIHHAWNASGGR